MTVFSDNELETFLALNSCTAGMVTECTFDGNTYTATLNYYVQDYYDFYEGNPSDGLNRVGFLSNDDYVLLALFDEAKPFDIIGAYSVNISWKKGSSEYTLNKG